MDKLIQLAPSDLGHLGALHHWQQPIGMLELNIIRVIQAGVEQGLPLPNIHQHLLHLIIGEDDLLFSVHA